MKVKTKKTISLIVSILMIVIIVADIIIPTRLYIIGLLSSGIHTNPESFNENYPYDEPFANLVLKTTAEDSLPDYGLHIVKDLRSIGLEVELKVEERSTFYSQLNHTHDY
ncbi:MAG: hypothetical protein KGD64_14815, partial [Candidatus Heimdallarchaeota archaeon]|nr:hypothetical protein [Candidatus Heimdallarchaeota archaeon]